MDAFDYDLFVIGSGPAGQRAAIQAAKLGKRTAIAESKAVIGGVCVNTGTIPSKTMREAVLHLSGYRERSVYGASYAVKKNITMADLHFRSDYVIKNELDVTRHQLQRNGVEVMSAKASFAGPNTVRLTVTDGRGRHDVTAIHFVIASGTETTKDPHIPFDGKRVFTSDDILELDELPQSLTVVGAGVIGLEYATIFAALGVRVTVVDMRPRLLPFIDHEITDTLLHQMRQNRVTMRLGEKVSGIELVADDRGERVQINLASGKQITTEKALYSVGRTGATDGMNLEAAGITADDRGRIAVNESYQSAVPHIYAAGDVIGFPSLASTSME